MGAVQTIDERTQPIDKLGVQVPRDLQFLDSRRYPLKLGQFFPGDRPLVLNLGYFYCPRVCGEVSMALARTINELDLNIGDDYQVLTLSFDPKETEIEDLARDKKDAFLNLVAKPNAAKGWHFATPSDDPEHTNDARKLAEVTGFPFVWNENFGIFDHPPMLVFLSAEGVVTRQLSLQGGQFSVSDVRMALIEAGDGTVGTFWDQLVSSCFTYDPRDGNYSVTAWTVMRIGGVMTILFLGGLIAVYLLRERRNRRIQLAPLAAGASPSHGASTVPPFTSS